MKEHQETINLSVKKSLARFMALLKTSSKSTLVFAVTWLLIALLATAEDGATQYKLGTVCEIVAKGPCTEKVCGGMCAVVGSNGIGSCQGSYCCCHPKSSRHIGVP
jgi:hypothetical protein